MMYEMRLVRVQGGVVLAEVLPRVVGVLLMLSVVFVPMRRVALAGDGIAGVGLDVLQVTVKEGDNVIGVLRNAGAQVVEAVAAAKSLSAVYNIDRINIGDKINVGISNAGLIHFVSVSPARSLYSFEARRDEAGGYSARVANNVQEVRVMRVSGPVEKSFFASAIEGGLSDTMIMQLVSIYGNRIDLDKIPQGSWLDVLFERFFNDRGDLIADGNVLYTALVVDGRRGKQMHLKLYRHLMKDGTARYCDSEGRSLGKSIFEHPIGDGGTFRVSSKFGTRKHPIRGYSGFHKGVDYAAPLGTPVKAADNGIVEFVGVKGTYGGYVRIHHRNHYSTAYAHLSKIRAELVRGSKVKRGQVIAYVGSTGLSTGPHLHYEVLYKGRHVDPQKVGIDKAVVELPQEEGIPFRETVANMDSMLRGDYREN
ncbi:M23 family metallopeptidase [Anaplasma centrale]|nr:M23 family metallopeptidase [Anaplasma centrale]